MEYHWAGKFYRFFSPSQCKISPGRIWPGLLYRGVKAMPIGEACVVLKLLKRTEVQSPGCNVREGR